MDFTLFMILASEAFERGLYLAGRRRVIGMRFKTYINALVAEDDNFAVSLKVNVLDYCSKIDLI